MYIWRDELPAVQCSAMTFCHSINIFIRKQKNPSFYHEWFQHSNNRTYNWLFKGIYYMSIIHCKDITSLMIFKFIIVKLLE